jgi:alpha-L-fucosidase
MESWGYKKDEDYYTDRHLIGSIDRYLARNANYLLNVGPTGEGVIPKEAADILRRIGRWKKMVDESYQNVLPDAILADTSGVLVTKRERTLYIHMNKALVGTGLKLKPIDVMPTKATLLNNGKPVDCAVNLCPSDHATQQPYLRLRNLPANELANTVLIAKLEFDRPLEEIVRKNEQDTNIELTK